MIIQIGTEADESRILWKWKETDEWSRADIDDLILAFESAQNAEPKTGKWILSNHLWQCNQCGCRVNRKNPLKGNIWNYNFCPNCGAKMLEEGGEA